MVTYGRVIKFPNLPTLQVTKHSENIPLTGAGVQFLIKRVAGSVADVTVSTVEMTFDVRVGRVSSILDQITHRAKRQHLLRDRRGRETLYIGSKISPWQVRIYQKTKSIVRIEFIFRKAFLLRHEIHRVEDVLMLRKLKIWNLISFRRFSRRRAERVTRDWPNKELREVIVDWVVYKRAIQSLVKMLSRNRVDPRRVLRRTTLQRTLEAMQRRFLW